MNPILSILLCFLTRNQKRKLYQFSKKHKISTIKRQQFYTHHRKSLRKLAYIHTIEQTESQFMREQKSSKYTLLQFAQT
jgi:hypothetical protein